MTMVPSESGNKQKSTRDYVFYSNNSAMNQVIEGGYNNNNNNYYNYLLGSSDHQFVVRHMAEEEDSSSRSVPNNNNNNTSTNTHHNNNNEPEAEAEAEAVSTSLKEEEEQEGGNNNNNNMSNWLQLSIGFHHQSQTHSAVTTTKHHYPPPTSGLELELLPPTNWASSPRPNSEAVTPAPRGCSSSSAAASSNLVFEQTTSSSTSSMPMPMPSGPTSLIGQQQQLLPQWAFGPLLPHSMPLIMPPSSSPSSYSSQYSCSSLRPPNFPLGPTFNYPHPHPHALPPFHYFAPSSSLSSGFNINDQFVDVAGPSSQSHHATATLRVVDPPRRPHSGIWFMLQASLNQAREPFLPQIPKNYLRIKDGRMTVRLLLKYLVSKLKLESESEIEITCRGQQLLPFLTLQHVRDNIWTPRDNTTTRPLLSDSSTTDHVMVLHYGRSTC